MVAQIDPDFDFANASVEFSSLAKERNQEEFERRYKSLFYSLRHIQYSAIFGETRYLISEVWDRTENLKPREKTKIVMLLGGEEVRYWSVTKRRFVRLAEESTTFNNQADAAKVLSKLLEKTDVRMLIVGAREFLVRRSYGTVYYWLGKDEDKNAELVERTKAYKKAIFAKARDRGELHGIGVLGQQEDGDLRNPSKYRQEYTDDDGQNKISSQPYDEEYWKQVNEKFWKPLRKKVLVNFDEVYGVKVETLTEYQRLCKELLDFGIKKFGSVMIEPDSEVDPRVQMTQKLKEINADRMLQRKLRERFEKQGQVDERPRFVSVNTTEIPGNGNGKILSSEEAKAHNDAIASAAPIDWDAQNKDIDHLEARIEFGRLRKDIQKRFAKLSLDNGAAGFNEDAFNSMMNAVRGWKSYLFLASYREKTDPDGHFFWDGKKWVKLSSDRASEKEVIVFESSTDTADRLVKRELLNLIEFPPDSIGMLVRNNIADSTVAAAFKRAAEKRAEYKKKADAAKAAAEAEGAEGATEAK